MEPERIKEFDILALLSVLESQGLTFENLVFDGNHTNASSPHLCEKLEGDVLTLNLGLLMAGSPLPNYFRQTMEKEVIDEEKFIPFLQFFNHHLIKNFLELSWIEKYLLKSWKTIQRSHLGLLGLNSVSSLYWLLSLTFPDLKLQVEKAPRTVKFACEAFRLSEHSLGNQNTLGGVLKQKIPTFQIHLTAESEQTDAGVFWPTEIRQRFRETIFPLLKKTRIYLHLYLTIHQYKHAIRLSSQTHLGFSSLGDSDSSFTWQLFSGFA